MLDINKIIFKKCGCSSHVTPFSIIVFYYEQYLLHVFSVLVKNKYNLLKISLNNADATFLLFSDLKKKITSKLHLLSSKTYYNILIIFVTH